MTARNVGTTVVLLVAVACNRPLMTNDGGASMRGPQGSGGVTGRGGGGEAGEAGGATEGGGGGGAGGTNAGAGGSTAGAGGGALGSCFAAGCPDGKFCELEPATCYFDAPRGACLDRPTVCTTDYDPVCGCDGKTYGSDCERRAAGVSLLSVGACDGTGVRCVSNDGRSRECRVNLFCEIPTGACRNDAPSPGICVARPGGCDEVYQPVCGCDEITYSNDCYRQLAGVTKLAEGVCVGACPPLPAVGAACANPGKVCNYRLQTGCTTQATCDATGHWTLSMPPVCPL